MIISVIAAYTKDTKGRQIIGKDNKLPWSISQDMAWFKSCTSGHAVLMGRKTHESIGRVLPKRDNIILTHDKDYRVPGAYVFNDLEDALQFAAPRDSELFVIGGEQIYRQVIDRVDRLYLTCIEKNPGYEGDTFFPSWNQTHFKVIDKHEIEDPKNGKVSFKVYHRHVYRQPKHFNADVVAAYSSDPHNPYAHGI
ncbi:MAG: dihydrofolate reductase [Candidatus Altiarchaeales archaeon]|nr:dihydrofolate reductase [Candidatus Altiarchaeales archaeon]